MESKEKFVIFYSWQSDISKKLNNYFILDCIRSAIKSIKKDADIKVEPRLDKDTLNIPGSPDIIDIIFKKIVASNIFICDVTPVYKKKLKKKARMRNTPNPNVLIELGYAVKTMGWSRIICICNEAFGEVVNLPFDIRKNRISTYTLNSIHNKKIVTEGLTELILNAVKTIINNYDKILSEGQEDDIFKHDLRIFEKLDHILHSDELLNLTEYIGTYLTIDNHNRNKLLSYRGFLVSEENKFLMKEIEKGADLLKNALIVFLGVLAVNLFVESSEKTINENTGEEERFIIYSLAPYEGGWKYEEYEKEKRKRSQEIIDSSFKLDEEYKKFRKSIKRNLFI